MIDIADELRAASCCNGTCRVPERQDELCINSRLRGRAADEIERLRHDWVVACKDLGEARADNEQLRAAIAHVCQRSQRACEILNEFDNTRAALEPKP